MANLNNIAALRSYTGSDTASIIFGYYSAGDNGGGVFVLVTSDTSADNAGTIIVDANGHRWHRQTNGDPVNVFWFGAYGDGTHDDTAAIQAAITLGQSTRLPTGTYLVTNALNCGTKGQVIMGDGRAASIVSVNTSFNMKAAGVFVFTSNEQAPQLRDFKITCVQPDTSVVGNLTTYPPAVNATSGSGQARFILTRMAITKFTTCVLMTGNCGGSTLADVQLSGLVNNVIIDGSADSVRLQSLHVWPFDLTTNQQSIFFATTSGVSSGRCDDLVLTDCLFLCRNQLILFVGTGSGTTFGSATNCGFDSYIGLTMAAGDFSINGGYFSLAPLGIPAIYQTGGDLRISNTWFNFSGTSSFPVVDLAVSSGNNGYLKLTGCHFEGAAGDTTSIYVTGVSGALSAIVNVANCAFQKNSNTSYTNPVVAVPTGLGRLSMSNCEINDKGTGSGTFIYIADDNWHRIIGNSSTGWSNTFPTASFGVYLYN